MTPRLFTLLLLLCWASTTGATTLRIEAEQYDDMRGIQLENNGSTVGYFDTGDWLKYEGIDWEAGYHSVAFRVAKANYGGFVEIRLDAPDGLLLGILTPSKTADWTVFEMQSTALAPAEGQHDLFLVARNAAGACNLDYFELRTTPLTTPNWVLRWSDEFEGEAIDESVWTKTHHGNPHNGELQFYTPRPENIVVSDGSLKLIARRETYTGQGPGMDAPATRQYTSGKIESYGKWSVRYGKIEARMKLPRGKGTWPAFWLLGDNIFDSGIGWPRCGEIDIMEHGQDFDHLGGAIHTEAYNHLQGTQITGTYAIDDYDTDFHTYGLIWDQDQLQFYVDASPYLTITKDNTGNREAEWPFDQPFWLILNHAVGGAWGGTPDDAQYPHTVEIDWVRVYEDQPLTHTQAPPEESFPAPYPNPSSGRVHLDLPGSPSDYILYLYDKNGREWLATQAHAKRATYDWSDLPSGIYLLTVYHRGRFLQSHRLVLE
ncbi:MAG: family 16 glycosylhydrolase [Bacteroidota bacterium]